MTHTTITAASSPTTTSRLGPSTIADVAHTREFFNLADEPWIDVMRGEQVTQVGVTKLFRDAHHIDTLGAVDPLTRMAT